MNNATSRPCSLGLAPYLIAVALDVVQPVSNDNHILGQGTFDGAELFGTRSLLLFGAGVYLVSKSRLHRLSRRS